MTRIAGADAATSTRTSPLALACIAVWIAAAASTGPLGIWLAIGGAAVALGAVAFVLDRGAATVTLRPTPALVLLGAVVGGVMTAATYALYPALVRVAPVIASGTSLLYSAFRTPSLAVASLALGPIIVGEELVWRGVVQSAFVARLGRWPGVSLAAIVYAVAHAPIGSPILVVVALSCGLVWGTLRAATGSLVPTLVAHLVWDFFVLMWFPLGPS